jgi:aspartyl/asparaginyl-tRNA synthetase
MAYLNLHEKLQQASRMLKEAQEAVIQAGGQDLQTLEQAENALNQVESELRAVQNQAGKEATENSQFQQAFESLHDIRQQVQEAQQNINDVL